MKLETHFDIGDIVYPVGRTYKTDRFSVRAAMPVDQILVEIDEHGITEIYGCEGTFESYRIADLFTTHQEAKTYADRLNKDLQI